MDLIPRRATFPPHEHVILDLDAPADGILTITHLADTIQRRPIPPGARVVDLGALPDGGYGAAFTVDGQIVASTAFDVLADPFERPRYGFIVQMDADTDPATVTRFYRRLHLNIAQFYDWGYRHSHLLPPERIFLDPLGQQRDLDIIDDLARRLTDAGTVPLGYSAVYAIGHDEVDQWSDALLLRSDGVPYRLGDDFLVIVDPAHPRWLAHYTTMLADALEGTALQGFHLDQYGWPKAALRGDGAVIDVADSFRRMIDAVHATSPDARLIFNNVNDFGTVQTATAAQDASYIEVWPPHSTLGDLGLLATRTRSLRTDHPPILSAYLSCYRTEPTARADAAAHLVMATAFSHGATHLLLGESGAALTDPYYPTNHRLTAESLDSLAPWYDFLVRWGDLLLDPEAVDVTEFTTGGINGDIVLSATGVTFSTKATAGTIWTRVMKGSNGSLVHLIDLREQVETEWDAGKNPPTPLSAVQIRVAPVTGAPTAWFASPSIRGSAAIALTPLPAGESVATDSLTAGQAYASFDLPTFSTWGFVWLPVDA